MASKDTWMLDGRVTTPSISPTSASTCSLANKDRMPDLSKTEEEVRRNPIAMYELHKAED
ncbi:hypothetical protein N7488_006381 [Penicillium malachiteum]|nr:hypothetical protein N7488_006381 [Penicillium malachiteum]